MKSVLVEDKINEICSSVIKQDEMMQETGSQTVRRVLGSYDLGRKLRQLRLRKKIGLVDLGKHTGLSASMLSQLENGKLVPTLPTLARIAMVFDVGLDHFFTDRRKNALFNVVRAGERMRFPDHADSPDPAWFFECLAFSTQEKSVQAYLATIQPREAKRVTEHVHDGAEFLYVLVGELGVRYGDEEMVLNTGDSAYFDGSLPHGYRALGEAPARALVFTTPPRL
jgi:transcriptional regulator with XRE-family HTH domain